MRRVILLGLVPGLVVGFLAGGLALFLYERSRAEHERVDYLLAPVLIFTRDLPAGADIGYADLAKIEMVESFVTPSVIRPGEVEQVIGRKLRHPVQQGDLVLRSLLEPSPAPAEGAPAPPGIRQPS